MIRLDQSRLHWKMIPRLQQCSRLYMLKSQVQLEINSVTIFLFTSFKKATYLHSLSLETKCRMKLSWNHLETLNEVNLAAQNQVTSGSLWLCFSGIFGALVQWPSGRIAQGPWCSRLFCSLACARPTTWAKSIQTTAPHGLGYSMLLACPLKLGLLSLRIFLTVNTSLAQYYDSETYSTSCKGL